MMRKRYTRSVTIQVPVTIVYQYIKNADARVKPLVKDLTPEEGIISTLEDIPNKRIVTCANVWGAETKIYTELKAVGENEESTEITVTIEPARMMGKTIGQMGLVSIIGECKSLEYGYLAGKKSGQQE